MKVDREGRKESARGVRMILPSSGAARGEVGEREKCGCPRVLEMRKDSWPRCCVRSYCVWTPGVLTSSDRSPSANAWAKGARTSCLGSCSPWASAGLAVSPLASTA